MNENIYEKQVISVSVHNQSDRNATSQSGKKLETYMKNPEVLIIHFSIFI